MDILIIGGTQFVGRALTAEGLRRGHKLTLFNRGRTNADLFPEAEKIVGDRDGGLDALAGRQWDAVIDTCGYFPRVVGDSARFLAAAVDRYLFISTISVYGGDSQIGMTESAELNRTLEDPTTEEITGETYGPLKSLSEDEVLATYPGRALIIRPGLITGPHDHTDRFPYWMMRVDKGGDVLVPSRPDRYIQHIDARDLANFSLDMLEQGVSDIFNATGPYRPGQTMGELIEACQAVTDSEATIHWVDEQFLLDNEVGPFVELPFWLPETEEYAGFMRYDCAKAQAAGLSYRPLIDTVRDTLAWVRTREGHTWPRNLAPERETELLEKWRAQ